MDATAAAYMLPPTPPRRAHTCSLDRGSDIICVSCPPRQLKVFVLPTGSADPGRGFTTRVQVQVGARPTQGIRGALALARDSAAAWRQRSS